MAPRFSGSTILTRLSIRLFRPVLRHLGLVFFSLAALVVPIFSPAAFGDDGVSSSEELQQELMSALDKRKARLDALPSPTASDWVQYCRYLSELNYLDLPIYEVLEERSEACASHIEQAFPEHPDTIRYSLEQQWTDFNEHFDRVVEGGLPNWSEKNKQALFQLAATRLENEHKAAAYALMLDDKHRTFHAYWKAVKYFKDNYPDDLPELPLATLRSLAVSGYEKNLYFNEFRNEDSQVVESFMAQLDAEEDTLSDGIKLALYASKNDMENVNRLVEESDSVYDIEVTLESLLSNPPAKLGFNARSSLYELWSGADWTRDPLLGMWFKLSKASGHQLGLPPFKSMVITLMLCIGFFLSPLLIVLPIHYLGLLRQRRQPPFEPIFSGLSLKSFLFVAGGIVLIDVFLTQFLVDIDVFASYFDPLYFEESGVNLADLIIYGTSLQLVLVLLVVNTRLFGLFRGSNRASMVKILSQSFLSVIACFFAIRVVNWIGSVEIEEAISNTLAIGDYITQLMREHGLWSTILYIAILGPLFEELLCRAIILNSTQRHIGFWAANVFQALVFMSLHLDTELYLYYFTFGFIAGLLYRSTRTLFAPVLMHVVINLFAVMSLWGLMGLERELPEQANASDGSASAISRCLSFDGTEPYARFLDCMLASEQGDIKGTDHAVSFLFSQYLPADHSTQALELLLDAGDSATGRSYYLIHRIYLISEEHKNPLLARQYLQKSADAGDSVGQSELASATLFGDTPPDAADIESAIALFEKAIDQDYAPARNELAWFYATTRDWAYRDGVRAIELMEPLLPVEDMPYSWLDTLAAAYAAAADFKRAAELQQQVVDKARQDRSESDLAGMLERLELFEDRKGYFSETF